MLTIKEVQIRNFRSIVNMTIHPADLSVFVGLNDAGKSNILKSPEFVFQQPNRRKS